MPVEVVARFDSPGRGPVGLAWDGRHLWQADFREGLIYQLNDTAEIIGTLRCPGNLGGLTWDGRSLWQALYEEGGLRRINPATNDFDQTIDLSGEGWLSGVAWDGQALRVVAQQSGVILSVDPVSGRITRRLDGPVAIGGMDYADGALWLSVAEPMAFSTETGAFRWVGDEPTFAIVQLDAQTGREITRYSMPGLYTGLAWGDGGILWLASAAEQCLYQVMVTPDD